MKIKALVAARSGSVRVENKNMKSFAGKTLLQYKLEQLKRLDFLDGVVLNSNDDEMLSLAESLDCEIVKRDEYYALGTTPMPEVFKNMAENMETDIILYTNCTNPLVMDKTYYDMFEFYKQMPKEFSSLNSAHLIKEFMFENNKPINFELDVHPRSQDLPDISALNFAINVLTKEQMIKGKSVIANNPYIYLIDEVEATDIDNPIDFEFAEFIFKKKLKNRKIIDINHNKRGQN